MIRIKTNFDLEDDIDAVEAAIQNGLSDLGDRMTARAIAYLRQRKVRATGDLIDSIDEMVKRFLSGFRLEWGPHVSYWEYVDQPTKPHWAPIKPFLKWVRVKFGLTGREKTSLAYAVRATIAKKGTKGVKFVDDVLRFIEPQTDKYIREAIDAKLR